MTPFQHPGVSLASARRVRPFLASASVPVPGRQEVPVDQALVADTCLPVCLKLKYSDWRSAILAPADVAIVVERDQGASYGIEISNLSNFQVGDGFDAREGSKPPQNDPGTV